MDLRNLHQSVVEGGNAEFQRALGLIDRHLTTDPFNKKARLYKGSLLTVLGQDEVKEQKAKIYIDTGLAMMLQAREEVSPASPERVEFDYICATTVAVLPGQERVTYSAMEQLTKLVAHKDFNLLTKFEQVRTLALASSVCLARDFPHQAKSLFLRATALNQPLASQVYERWLEGSST